MAKVKTPNGQVVSITVKKEWGRVILEDKQELIEVLHDGECELLEATPEEEALLREEFRFKEADRP